MYTTQQHSAALGGHTCADKDSPRLFAAPSLDNLRYGEDGKDRRVPRQGKQQRAPQAWI